MGPYGPLPVPFRLRRRVRTGSGRVGDRTAQPFHTPNTRHTYPHGPATVDAAPPSIVTAPRNERATRNASAHALVDRRDVKHALHVAPYGLSTGLLLLAKVLPAVERTVRVNLLPAQRPRGVPPVPRRRCGRGRATTASTDEVARRRETRPAACLARPVITTVTRGPATVAVGCVPTPPADY